MERTATGFAPVQRPEITFFYVLDTSGSMDGLPIGVLNRAMTSTVDAIRQVAAQNSNYEIKIAVMEFNSHCRWIQPQGPEYLRHFVWEDLRAHGMTIVGEALDELNGKLSRRAWLSSTSGSYLPIIIFMTDGFAVDDYSPALERIKQNEWFSRAMRIGFAIGRRPDTHMIAELAGDSDRVIRTNELAVFAKMIRFVSVSSLTISSRLASSTYKDRTAEIMNGAATMAGVDPSVYAPGFQYHEAPTDVPVFVDGA